MLAVDALSEEEATVLLETTVQKEWALSNAKLRASCSRTLNRFASNHTASLIALGKYMRLNAPLKVYEDKTLGLPRDDTTKLLLTPWTKILPRASGIYIGEYDRLSALHQLLAKVVAVVLTEGQLLVVPESLVLETIEWLTAAPRGEIEVAIDDLVTHTILHRWEDPSLSTPRTLRHAICFDEHMMRDTVRTLVPPGLVAEICRSAVSAMQPIIARANGAPHFLIACALLRLRYGDTVGAVSDLDRAMRNCQSGIEGEESLIKILAVSEKAAAAGGKTADLDVAVATKIGRIGLSRKSSCNLHSVRPPFDVDALPYVDDSAYDMALKSMCIQVNSVSIMMKVSGSATLDDVLGLSKAAALYAEEVKRVARYSNFHDTTLIESVVHQLLVTEATELSIDRMVALEQAMQAFLADGAMRLKQAVDYEQAELKRATVVWGPQLSNGWDEQDSQHKWLVDNIGAFQKLLREAAAKNESLDPSVVGGTLDSLSAYVVFHFEMEELAMDHAGYPRAEIHKGIHEHFVEKVNAVRARVLQGDYSVVGDLTSFLLTWLVTHIHGEDMTLATWMRAHPLGSSTITRGLSAFDFQKGKGPHEL